MRMTRPRGEVLIGAVGHRTGCGPVVSSTHCQTSQEDASVEKCPARSYQVTPFLGSSLLCLQCGPSHPHCTPRGLLPMNLRSLTRWLRGSQSVARVLRLSPQKLAHTGTLSVSHTQDSHVQLLCEVWCPTQTCVGTAVIQQNCILTTPGKKKGRREGGKKQKERERTLPLPQ